MYTGNLWRFLILETFVMGVLCCWCPYEHPQTSFCKSEFVLKVDIRSNMTFESHNAFRMDIKEIFKGDVVDAMQPRFFILLTNRKCPTDAIKTENTYIIFGMNYYEKRVIETIACNGIIPWKKTTVFYRQALAEYYKDNCDCYPTADDIPIMQRRCKWNSFMRKNGTSNVRLYEKELLNGLYWN